MDVSCTTHGRAACCPPSTSGRYNEAAAENQLRRQQRRSIAQLARQRTRCRRLVAAAAQRGGGGDKPEWFQQLEEAAELDDAAARILAGSNGDPDLVQQRMRAEMDALHARIMGNKYGGEDAPIDISFREVDQFNLWVWMELYRPPTPTDVELLQEVLNSWFLVGRLGGYNSSNLQVLYHQDGDLEELAYDADEAGGMPATFHDITPLEANGSWVRFWLDMGTSDELALDVLINMLTTFSKEQLGIRQLVVGGENADWPVPQREDFLPEVTMDPMRGPLSFGGQDDD